jgi:tetratricopeptide (TPR) repeat protein
MQLAREKSCWMYMGTLGLVATGLLLPLLMAPAAEKAKPRAVHRQETVAKSAQGSGDPMRAAPEGGKARSPSVNEHEAASRSEERLTGSASPQNKKGLIGGWRSLSLTGQFEVIGGAAALIAAILVLLFERRRRAENREKVTDEAGRFLQLVSTSVIKKETGAGNHDNASGLIDDFFLGKNVDINCLHYVSLELDARRGHLLSVAQEKLSREHAGPHCVQIVGARQQGKTMLMARLAYTLAEAGATVYWCRADRSKEARQQWHVLRALFRLRPWFWRFTKRRIYVFIDDIFSPAELVEDTADAEQAARNILNALGKTNTTAITSCVKPIFPNLANVDTIGVAGGIRGSDLDMNEMDAKAIVDKWRQAGHLTEAEARDFLGDLESRKLYRKRLFAFLCVLFETVQATTSHGFMIKFKREFDGIADPRKNLLPIASCQLMNVPVPRRVVEHIDPSFEMDHSIVTQSLFQSDPEDPDDVVYVMEGLFLPRWLLRKVEVDSLDDLVPVYGSLINACIQIDNFGFHASEKNFLPYLLHELARGVNEDIVGGSGEDVARTVFNNCKDSLVEHFHQVVKRHSIQTELILWGWAFKALFAWNLAEEAYLAAVECTSPHPSLTDRLRLINGLKELPSVNSRKRAVPIAEALLEELILEKGHGQLACEVFTAYCDLLGSIGDAKKALDRWTDYQARDAFKPDVLLYTMIGSLYERLGEEHIQDARNAYLMATLLREPSQTDSPSRVRAVQRYAMFLGLHPVVGQPTADAVFAEAIKLAGEHHVGAETILPSQAEYEERRGHFREARTHFAQAVEAYRKREIVEGYAWTGLASLLIDHVGEFKPESEGSLLEEAETLLEELENDEFCYQRSKRVALALRGHLVAFSKCPYKYKGRERPDLEEGKFHLTAAFESPPGVRDDPEAKTFHDSGVHSSLAQVYRRQTNVAYQNAIQTSGSFALVRELAGYHEYHVRKAFEGLPRRDTPDDKVKHAVLHRRAFLALFLWREKPRYFPELHSTLYRQAEALYLDNITCMESFGWGFPPEDGRHLWHHACEAYLNFAWLRCVNKGPIDTKLLHACEATAKCLPGVIFSHQGAANQLQIAIRFLIGGSKVSASAPASIQREALLNVKSAKALAEASQAKFPESFRNFDYLLRQANGTMATLDAPLQQLK